MQTVSRCLPNSVVRAARNGTDISFVSVTFLERALKNQYRPLSVGGNAVELEDRTMVALCMIIDFIAAWRFSFFLSSSSEVLTSHLKEVYTRGLRIL